MKKVRDLLELLGRILLQEFHMRVAASSTPEHAPSLTYLKGTAYGLCNCLSLRTICSRRIVEFQPAKRVRSNTLERRLADKIALFSDTKSCLWPSISVQLSIGHQKRETNSPHKSLIRKKKNRTGIYV